MSVKCLWAAAWGRVLPAAMSLLACPGGGDSPSLRAPSLSVSRKPVEPRGGQLDSRSPARFHVRNWKLMETPSCAGVPGSTKWLPALGNVTGTGCGWEQEKETLP